MAEYKILVITNYTEADNYATKMACKIAEMKNFSIELLCKNYKYNPRFLIKKGYEMLSELQKKYKVKANITFSEYENWYSINKKIEKEKINLIVFSSENREARFARKFLKAIGEKNSKCSLLIVDAKNKYKSEISELVYVTDFKNDKPEKFDKVLSLSKVFNSSLSVLNPNPLAANMESIKNIEKIKTGLDALPEKKRGNFYLIKGLYPFLNSQHRCSRSNSMIFIP